MRERSRALAAAVGAAAVILSLAACTSTPTVHPTTTPLPSAHATFSGTESGKVYLTHCGSGNNDQIAVVVNGSTTRLRGELSASNVSFDGKDSEYLVKKTGTLPSFSTDGRHIQVDGVILVSVLKPSNSVTLSGTLVCP